MKPPTVQQTVHVLDRERVQVFFRSHELARRKGQRQPAEVVKAKTRLRAARWRTENDRNGRPETAEVAMSLLRSLVRQHDEESIHAALSVAEWNVVRGMISELTGSGYRLDQIIMVCRRLRARVCAEEAGSVVRPPTPNGRITTEREDS